MDSLGFIKSKTRKSYSTYLFGNEPVTLEIVYSILEDYCFASLQSSYQNNLRKTTLKFAWENNYASKTLIEEAKQRTIDTEILVVIGYSFPDYNRPVDRALLGNMNALKNVYVMDSATNTNLRINEIRKMNANSFVEHTHSDFSKFVIPNELNS